jgi:hypothetical protein
MQSIIGDLMDYEIYIDNKLYKTITTEGGYSINEISIQLHKDNEDEKLTGFDLSKGFSVKPV